MIPVNQPFEAFYLPSQPGRIFCVHFQPDKKRNKLLIYLPSVAEEMNRCRAMVAAQSRYFAAKGIGVVLVDYFGTGDSQGDFSETDWDIWKQNILDVNQWALEEGYDVTGLWGLRMGAMLAAELSSEYPEMFTQLVLWQPVVSGQSYLTHILRMRMAGQMERNEAIEKTDVIRARMQAGEGIEIGGYLFSGQLGCQLDSKKLTDYKIHRLKTVDWFEGLRSHDSNMPIGSKKIQEAWEEQGTNLSVHVFVGDSFWQMPERAFADDLLEVTTRVIQA